MNEQDQDLCIVALLGAAAGFASYALWKSWPKTSFLVDVPHAWGSLTNTVQSLEVTPLTYVSPTALAGPTGTTSTVTFTGTALRGRVRYLYNATDAMFHTIMAVVDPVGSAVGTLTVTPAIPSANAVLRIPGTTLPLAIGASPRVDSPMTLLSADVKTAVLPESPDTDEVDVERFRRMG